MTSSPHHHDSNVSSSSSPASPPPPPPPPELFREEVTFVTSDGNKYIGQAWVDGRSVVGSLFYANGDRYQGEVNSSGAPDGYGSLTTVGSNGGTIVYDGDWKGGVRSGTGRLRRFRKGVSSNVLYLFEGSFLNDMCSGAGTETIRSATDGRLQEKFTGSFLLGNRHGHNGLLEDERTGRLVEGEFREGYPWGRVIVKWQRENLERLRSYDGEFEQGEMHGSGTLVSSNGEFFRGEFCRGKKVQGLICDADGSHARRAKYDANGVLVEFEDLATGSRGITMMSPSSSPTTNTTSPIKQQQKQQKEENQEEQEQEEEEEGGFDAASAQIEFPNGDLYNGQTVSGKMHGTGRLEFKIGGGCYVGNFVDGKFHGFGTMCRTPSAAGAVGGTRPTAAQLEEARSKMNSLFQQEKEHDGSSETSSSSSRPVLLKETDAWRYEGNFAKGEFSGFGKMWTFGGHFFEGCFLHNEMTGMGRAVYASNNIDALDNSSGNSSSFSAPPPPPPPPRYEGEFLHGRPHGRGALWTHDKVIRGTFVNDVCVDEHGTVEYFAPRIVMMTTHQQAAATADADDHHENDGKGKGNGSVVATTNSDLGTKKIVLEHPPLQQQDEDREVVERYEGGVVGNMRSGSGEHHYRNGDVYFGEWANDGRHGVGILTFASDGTTFEGRFANDQPITPCNSVVLTTKPL